MLIVDFLNKPPRPRILIRDFSIKETPFSLWTSSSFQMVVISIFNLKGSKDQQK